MSGNTKWTAHSRVFLKQVLSIALLLVAGLPALAQQANDKPRSVREDAARLLRPSDPSDLGQQNLGRVAASAAQLKAVLVKDEGLLIELKRWIAKEATDSGQVVEDSDLTEAAVFER